MSNTPLDKQIDHYIDTLESYNKKLPHPRAKENYVFLRHFFKHFIKEHNERSDEVASTAYGKIRDLAYAQFPVKTFWNYCIDGRVLGILAHGASANIGMSIRVPGGILREFVRDAEGKLKILPDSVFAEYIKNTFSNFDVDTIAEVFDSHVGCAARYVEEKEKGRDPADFGLLADVSHKLQMAQATQGFVATLTDKDQRAITIQTSFDPHTGFLYMGLETSQAFGYARKHGNVYSDKNLDALVQQGKILSTEQLVTEEKILAELQKHYFQLDWQNKYIKTAELFWQTISKMKITLLPILEKKLLTIYPYLSKKNTATEQELKERAILLLTNMFSGYLNNVNKPRSKKVSHKEIKETIHKYPYGDHTEEAVRISEGSYPPYKTSMFSVFNSEDENLPSHVKLTTSLVRKNRLDGRVTDPTHSFTTNQSFAEATVPVIIQEIVRDPISEENWHRFSAIDWSNMPPNWEKMSDDEFYTYLKSKSITQFDMAISINKLRRRMAILYYPYNSISSRFIENYMIALPIIAGRYRKNHCIVPFVKYGFV